MTLAFGIATYFIFWWMVFFTILPIGVRTQHDEGSAIAPGMADSAPIAPRLVFKALLTTGISAVLFGIFYVVLTRGLVTLDDIPFLPRFDTVQ